MLTLKFAGLFVLGALVIWALFFWAAGLSRHIRNRGKKPDDAPGRK